MLKPAPVTETASPPAHDPAERLAERDSGKTTKPVTTPSIGTPSRSPASLGLTRLGPGSRGQKGRDALDHGIPPLTFEEPRPGPAQAASR